MLITTPRSLNEALKLTQFEVGFLVGVKGVSANHHNNFDLAEITELLKFNKLVMLRLDNLYYDAEQSLYLAIIEKFQDQVLYYVNDLGLVQILSEHSLQDKTIYDPQTMVTNYLDFAAYEKIGLAGVGVSLEIPIIDVLKMNTQKMFYQFFGYRQMFVSRRKVLSLYEEQAKVSFSKRELYLIEQTRKDVYPCFEDERGCYIYRSYAINLLEHLLKAQFKYVLLDSLLIAEEKYLQVVEIYAALLKGKLTLTEAQEEFVKLQIKTEEGFTYKDSVYQKEEF